MPRASSAKKLALRAGVRRWSADPNLVRLGTSETLAAAYGAWSDLLAARRVASQERAAERERLTREAAYLLGALDQARRVKIAPQAKGRALVRVDSLAAVQARAESEQKEALAALERREKGEESSFEKAIAKVRAEIQARAQTLLRGGGARLSLTVLPVAEGRAVVHATRPSDDEAVLICMLLSRKLPTRHFFFSDDASDDATLEPGRFYPDERISQVRFGSADEEDQVVEHSADFVPVRMHIPMRLPDRDFPRFRLVHHGPEAELESRREGEPYRHILSREDAELFTGYMLRMKVEGQLDVSVHVG